jgi:hypothetical protein
MTDIHLCIFMQKWNSIYFTTYSLSSSMLTTSFDANVLCDGYVMGLFYGTSSNGFNAREIKPLRSEGLFALDGMSALEGERGLMRCVDEEWRR